MATCHPNPFNPLTSIAFDVAKAGRVSLRIYDIAGRPVRTLAEGWREPQRYQISWDGRDDKGRAKVRGRASHDALPLWSRCQDRYLSLRAPSDVRRSNDAGLPDSVKHPDNDALDRSYGQVP